MARSSPSGSISTWVPRERRPPGGGHDGVVTTVDLEGYQGLRLAGERFGGDGDPAVVFLHGGGQTRHSWGGTAARVADRGVVTLTLDARGHGDSNW